MKHDIIEKNVGLMMILILVALSFGTLVELVPLIFSKQIHEPIARYVPYLDYYLQWHRHGNRHK